MASACVKLLLLAGSASTSLGLRRSGKKARQNLQRNDDVQMSPTFKTFLGCRCKNECQVSSTLNCVAKTYCNVERSQCPGSKWHLIAGQYDWCVFPDDSVRSSSAAQRHAQLVSELKRDRKSHPFYGSVSVLLGVSGESVIDTMEMEGDVFPYPREKFVRPVGVVAPISFVSKGNHEYTGIFKGNSLGIVRLSLSLEPNDKNGFAPGIAVKFLRNNRPSANFFGFHDFVGQNCSEKNFFKTNLYSHVPSATGLSALVPRRFRQATGCHQMVGLSDAADEFNGKKPVSPWEVVFTGVPSVDFSCEDQGAAGWANLGKLSKGTTIYTVKARRNPGDRWVAIGDIVLQDRLITSKFGDEELFFRHQRMEEDFKLHPEWLRAIDKVQDCGTDYASTTPPLAEDGCDYASLPAR